MVWFRERTTPTERPPLVGEVSVNFFGYMVPRGQHDGSLRPYSRFSRPGPLLFYQVAPQLYSRDWVDHNKTSRLKRQIYVKPMEREVALSNACLLEKERKSKIFDNNQPDRHLQQVLFHLAPCGQPTSVFWRKQLTAVGKCWGRTGSIDACATVSSFCTR
jgi:hypothetical protein